MNEVYIAISVGCAGAGLWVGCLDLIGAAFAAVRMRLGPIKILGSKLAMLQQSSGRKDRRDDQTVRTTHSATRLFVGGLAPNPLAEALEVGTVDPGTLTGADGAGKLEVFCFGAEGGADAVLGGGGGGLSVDATPEP